MLYHVGLFIYFFMLKLKSSVVWRCWRKASSRAHRNTRRKTSPQWACARCSPAILGWRGALLLVLVCFICSSTTTWQEKPHQILREPRYNYFWLDILIFMSFDMKQWTWRHKRQTLTSRPTPPLQSHTTMSWSTLGTWVLSKTKRTQNTTNNARILKYQMFLIMRATESGLERHKRAVVSHWHLSAVT